MTGVEGLLGARRSARIVRVGRKRATTNPGGAALARAEDDLDAVNRAWSVRANRLMAVLTLAAMAIVASLWSVIGASLAVPILVLGIVLSSYYGLCAILLAHGHIASYPWLPWISTAIEASFGTIVLVIITHVEGPAWAATSPTLLIYPVVIAVSAARLRPALCIFAAAVSAIEYVTLHDVSLSRASGGDALPTLGNWAAAERAFWLMMTGVVTAFVTRKARDLALASGLQASERHRLEREFGRYVSRDVADAILRGDAGRAERRQLSVLFCDLRSFTSICEREPAERVVEMLNTFYEQACAIIDSHGGTVNKFMGDGVLALFGAPDEHPNHVRAAAEAAHDLVAAADELRRRGGIWRHFDVGIGMDTGEVVVGPVGASRRLEYTAIGPTVNRAARLQSLAGQGRRRIVLSAACLEALGPHANVVSIGAQSLKGFAAPEPVYVFRHS